MNFYAKDKCLGTAAAETIDDIKYWEASTGWMDPNTRKQARKYARIRLIHVNYKVRCCFCVRSGGRAARWSGTNDGREEGRRRRRRNFDGVVQVAFIQGYSGVGQAIKVRGKKKRRKKKKPWNRTLIDAKDIYIWFGAAGWFDWLSIHTMYTREIDLLVLLQSRSNIPESLSLRSLRTILRPFFFILPSVKWED